MGDGSFVLPIEGVVSRFGEGEGEGERDGIAVEDGEGRGEEMKDGEERDSYPLPSHGYTTLLSLTQPSQQVVIRKEDGFEKRGVWKCGRCAVPVGYEVWAEAKGKEVAGEEGFDGKILFLLRGSLMSTEVMRSGKRVVEGDAEVLGMGVGVWE